MSEEEIKELIQSTLEESGYMYTLGMLKGMYKAGAFDYILDDVKILIKGVMSLRE